MEVIDAPLVQNETEVKYGGFWLRLGALIIDGLILAPISVGVGYFNGTTWKSLPILIVLSLVTLSYKPLMELVYGATLGKMAFKLKVVNVNFDAPGIREALLRNIFNIVPDVAAIFFSVYMFMDPEFESVTGLMEFYNFSQKFATKQLFDWIVLVILLVDMIVLLSDKEKRSLHDKIGGTYVLEQS